LINHFAHTGGYYPIGGASEIAYNMIPIIEKSGGKVLVKANVTEILCNDQGEACGVLVKKGSEQYRLNAPLIISNAGAYNTFQRLLPKEISQKSYYTDLLENQMKPGMAALSIFVGMDASHDELGLKAQNTWAFTSNSWLAFHTQQFSKYEVLSKFSPDSSLYCVLQYNYYTIIQITIKFKLRN
jgi:all-trans-retinol 13,14-reductase